MAGVRDIGDAESGRNDRQDGIYLERLRWHDARRGYVRWTVAPDAWTADYRAVPFVSRPGAPVETASSWRLAHGCPGLERV